MSLFSHIHVCIHVCLRVCRCVWTSVSQRGNGLLGSNPACTAPVSHAPPHNATRMFMTHIYDTHTHTHTPHCAVASGGYDLDSLAADDLEYNYDMAGLAALRRRLAAAIHDFKGASVQYEAVIRQVRPHLLDFGGKPCLGLGVEVQVGTHSNCCSTAPSCNYVSGCVCVCAVCSACC